ERYNDKERYAVVLKVRGANVVLRETLPDFGCTKIVLEPDGKPVVLRNFLTDDKETLPLLETKPPHSKPAADDPAVRTITVFRQLRASAKNEDPSVAAVRRGQLPLDRPTNLEELKAQLRKSGSRCVVIDEGAKKAADLRPVEFRVDPRPVVSATVRFTG